MEIKEMTATTTTATATATTTAIGHLLHHHHHQPAATAAAKAAAAAVAAVDGAQVCSAAAAAATSNQVPQQQQQRPTTTKHERISLKKLHSLRNQLFCGFKSFTSSHDQLQSKSRSGNKQQAAEVLQTGSNDQRLAQEADTQSGASVAACSCMMIVAQHQKEFASVFPSGGCSGGSKSSSVASLSPNQQQQQQQQAVSSSDQESSHLIALLANSAPQSEDNSLRVETNGCSLKRASFRRLTGRASAAISRQKQPLPTTTTTTTTTRDDQSEKKMTKLIKQLDQLADNNESSARESEDDVFYLEKSWTNFVRINDDDGSVGSECEPTAKLQNLKIQQDAIWELLTSEVFYLKRLRVILDIFLETLTNLQQDSLLQEIGPTKLVSNIEEVYQANHAFWTTHLLPMLVQSRLSNRPLEPSSMKEAFVNIRSLFGSYYRYCLEHTACLDYLRDRNKHDQYFKVYLAWCESQKDCERLRLMDLLAKPMQRLTKYPLLLKAIHRKTDNPKQSEDLRQMIVEMEKFVLTVDLQLRDRDELAQLHSVAERIESLDIGSSDIYCDEVNKIITQYCQTFRLCEPIFSCPFACNRRLIFDSSQQQQQQQQGNNLGQIRFKDAQLGSKLDVVLLLLTDQLLICKQVSNRWYAAQNGQERSPIHSLKSSVYRRRFNSSQRHRSPRKSSPQAGGWSKSRSTSGNHLVDSLILANERVRQNQPGELLLSANTSGDRPASFHLSTSSLAGDAAREHFAGSKSADGSRSGDSFIQSSPKKSLSAPQPPRLRVIRSPYPTDRLVLHELSDGQRVFCCQLNDSHTIAASFILHIGHSGATNQDTPKSHSRGDQLQQQNNASCVKNAGASAESDSAMHHLSPLSGLSRRSRSNNQNQNQNQNNAAACQQVSPARKLINLIQQAQLKYRAAASFHGVPLSQIDTRPRQRPDITFDSPNLSTNRTRSSELLQLSNLSNIISCRDDPISWPLDIDDEKAVLEQEQSMLLKHRRYDELQTCKLDYMLADRRTTVSHLDPIATSSFVSPLLSVSIEDPRQLRVQQKASSQSSVFELDGHYLNTLGAHNNARMIVRTELSSETSAQESANEAELAFDRRRGQSWSWSSAHLKRLASLSRSELESTASDISPIIVDGQQQQRLSQASNHRRQVNHLRRQNDIISQSHEQHENWIQSGSSLRSGDQSSSVDETDGRQLDSLTSSTNYRYSCSAGTESSQNDETSRRRSSKYLSLARRLVQEQNCPQSQTTTLDQGSITLNDNQTLDSMESYECQRALSIELGNLKARLSVCSGGTHERSRAKTCPFSQEDSCQLENRLVHKEPDTESRGQIRVRIQQVDDKTITRDNDDDHVGVVPVLNVTSADSPKQTKQQDKQEPNHNPLPTGSSSSSSNRRGVKCFFWSRDPSKVRAISHGHSEGNLREPLGGHQREARDIGDGDQVVDSLQPASSVIHQRDSTISLDGHHQGSENKRDGEDGSAMCQMVDSAYDSEWTGLNYRGNLLELKCIHKLIHQDSDSKDSACGKVYLGFYEKLDLHLKQTSDRMRGGCHEASMQDKIASERFSQIHREPIKRQDRTAGRHSPAKSDSSATSRGVRSLKLFTNDLIGSLLRATSSCSVQTKN